MSKEFLSSDSIQNLFKELGGIVAQVDNTSYLIKLSDKKVNDLNDGFHSLDIRVSKIEDINALSNEKFLRIKILEDKIDVLEDEIEDLKNILTLDEASKNRLNKIIIGIIGAVGGMIPVVISYLF